MVLHLCNVLVLNALALLFHSDQQSGELLISNHTDSNTGTYMCEAKNAVGSAQCKYELHAYNRKSIISSSNFTLST